MNKRIPRELLLLNGTLQGQTIIVSENIKFVLPLNYPFKAPTMLIHSADHLIILYKLYRKYFFFIVKYDIPIRCICCSSLICMWSPCNTCKDVYDEYMNYIHILKPVIGMTTLFKQTPFDDNICLIIAQFLV
jgi:hypothetical protein